MCISGSNSILGWPLWEQVWQSDGGIVGWVGDQRAVRKWSVRTGQEKGEQVEGVIFGRGDTCRRVCTQRAEDRREVKDPKEVGGSRFQSKKKKIGRASCRERVCQYV